MNKAALIAVAVVVVGAVGLGAFFLLKSGGEKPAEGAKAETAASGPAKPPAAPAAEPAKPLPPPRLVEETKKPEGSPLYRIELAAFVELTAAKEFQGEMGKRNLTPEIVEIVDISGRSWYHVRVGTFTDPDQAKARLPEINRISGMNGIVMREVPSPQPPAR